jgi:hypothetical protein
VKKLAICANILAFTVAGGPLMAAQESVHSYSPITVAEAWQAVASELRGRGFREEQLPRAEDLELPVAVPARAGRNLHVSSVCWDSDSERARFRIECREAGGCLPFLAYLRRDYRASARAEAPSCRQESHGHSSSFPHTEPSIRAGERAIAVLSAAGVRLSAAVTCLDRGARGEIIRVRSEEGHIFRARVAGPALVEALPE